MRKEKKHRRTRIEHPQISKSKAHWDWESGYGDMEVPMVIPNSKSNHTTKIVVCTFVIIGTNNLDNN